MVEKEIKRRHCPNERSKINNTGREIYQIISKAPAIPDAIKQQAMAFLASVAAVAV